MSNPHSSIEGLSMDRAGTETLCMTYDVALLDLDGVVYIGRDAVPGAITALRTAAAQGMRLSYVTNNAARPPSVVREHLLALGLTLTDDDVVTSSQAAASLLATHLPLGSLVAAVGGAGVAEALRTKGFRVVDLDDSGVQAVVMGYGPDVSWRDLAGAAFAIQAGAQFIATNTDRTIPTARGIAPGNGMLVQAVIEATGVTPQIAGKPQPTLFSEAVTRANAKRALVVGDRLDTDIEGAVNAGLDSLLVLTGVTSAREAVLAPARMRPTYVADDLKALMEVAPMPVAFEAGWICGGWSAHVVHERSGPSVQVKPHNSLESPRSIDAVRAACAAAAASADPVLAVVGLP